MKTIKESIERKANTMQLVFDNVSKDGNDIDSDLMMLKVCEQYLTETLKQKIESNDFLRRVFSNCSIYSDFDKCMIKVFLIEFYNEIESENNLINVL